MSVTNTIVAQLWLIMIEEMTRPEGNRRCTVLAICECERGSIVVDWSRKDSKMTRREGTGRGALWLLVVVSAILA